MRRKKTPNPSLTPPEPHLDGKDGPFCAEADVARRDQVESGAEADAVHGGDDGFVARLNGRDAALQEIHVLGRGILGVSAALGSSCLPPWKTHLTDVQSCAGCVC